MGRTIYLKIAYICALLFVSTGLFAVSAELGPFFFQIDSGVQVDAPAFRFYNDPICRAISTRKLLILRLQNKDTIERMIVEPYIFGYTEKHELVLQGAKVKQLKLDEDRGWVAKDDGQSGGIFSMFGKSGWSDISFDKVRSIEVIEDSNFLINEEIYKDIQEKSTIVEPICMVQP